MPAASPTAFDEQLELGIETVILLAKFVQPLNWRYDLSVGVNVESYLRTEFVTIVCGSDEGQLWCCAASSAAEAITATPCAYAELTACLASAELLSVPSASWMTSTSLSVA